MTRADLSRGHGVKARQLVSVNIIRDLYVLTFRNGLSLLRSRYRS